MGVRQAFDIISFPIAAGRADPLSTFGVIHKANASQRVWRVGSVLISKEPEFPLHDAFGTIEVDLDRIRTDFYFGL